MSSTKSTSSHQNARFSKSSSFFVAIATGNKQQHFCIFCKASHLIYKCPSFLAKSPQERFQLAKENNWCINCLHSAHRLSACHSTFTCRTCKGKHHTLLHFTRQTPQAPDAVSQSTANVQSSQQREDLAPSGSNSSPVHTLANNILPSRGTVLLSTAMVEISDHQGHFHVVRALLDSASEISVLSQKWLQRLGLTSSNVSLLIFGLGQIACSSSQRVTCTIRPNGQQLPNFTIDAVVLPNICGHLPSSQISTHGWTHIANLRLADPQFNVPGPIDLLLGADIFPLILKDDRISGELGEPTALSTAFGWVLMG